MKVNNGVSQNNIASQVKSTLNNLVKELGSEFTKPATEKIAADRQPEKVNNEAQSESRRIHSMFGKGTQVYQVV